MRLLRSPRHSPQHSSSICIEQSSQYGSGHTASRHDEQLLGGRPASADPYAAWLQQREADRARAENSLDPRATWDELRAQSLFAGGRR